jgi:putative addiction module component (TIGR02574 family)
MSALKDIEQVVLALPIEQRVQLAESLLDSLPSAGKEWSEAEVLAEVERRERQIQSGEAQAIPEGQFWEKVEARRKR